MPGDRSSFDDKTTLRFYAEKAEIYVASGPGGASPRLHDFLKKLTPGARILELGCGSGRDAEAMIKAGFETGGLEGRDDHGRYFNYLARAEVLELYRTAAPWEVEEVLDTVEDGYLGKRSPWVAITVQKADRR